MRRIYHHPEYDFCSTLIWKPKAIHGYQLDRATQIRTQLHENYRIPEELFFSLPQSIEAYMEPNGDHCHSMKLMLEQTHDAAVYQGLYSSAYVARALELFPLALVPNSMLYNMVVRPQTLAAAGTCEAFLYAAEGGWAFNLSGGFHHAHPNLSHGFCLVNDIALGVTHLRQHKGRDIRILILDMDNHFGDGNAAFFRHDLNVYTILHTRKR